MMLSSCTDMVLIKREDSYFYMYRPSLFVLNLAGSISDHQLSGTANRNGWSNNFFLFRLNNLRDLSEIGLTHLNASGSGFRNFHMMEEL